MYALREDNNIFTLNIPEQCQVFANKFDELQSSISKVSVSNEMLAGIYVHRIISTCIFLIIGMLSKAKSQILRVAACMHMLFSDFKDIENEDVIPVVNQISTEISEAALIAAENFVKMCCQHCLFLSGKGILDNEIKRYSEGT